MSMSYSGVQDNLEAHTSAKLEVDFGVCVDKVDIWYRGEMLFDLSSQVDMFCYCSSIARVVSFELDWYGHVVLTLGQLFDFLQELIFDNKKETLDARLVLLSHQIRVAVFEIVAQDEIVLWIWADAQLTLFLEKTMRLKFLEVDVDVFVVSVLGCLDLAIICASRYRCTNGKGG
ncbi:hypothetical protein K504DRAFT_508311 [Pleomassaria siparia CBS 279.74]|uniref:Uncharacterized protein n=1 Tax=Pleomassaria siparia CBS 279.74 TaxID=1314801 RepID=A0A6G1JR92_9PLEO|nr:hypothetical protein K504DRAFT_508311 [Pleomassaria siparia CBS 279.74]